VTSDQLPVTNYQFLINFALNFNPMKRTYISPVLEHIIIDKSITLMMNSAGSIPPNPEFSKGEDEKKQDKPMESPFGE